MRVKKSFVLSVLASALAVGSAFAGAPPPIDFPTDTIVPHIPPGWKNSTLNGGAGYAELGEFTPNGQPTDDFTDLVGFTRNPIPPGLAVRPDVDFGGAIKASLDAKCSAVILREMKPVGAQSGWQFYQSFCVLKSGSSTGRVDLTFTAVRLRPTTRFTVWRAWRGTPVELRRFVAQTGKIHADLVVSKQGALAFDEKAVDRAAPAILRAWSDTFTKVELCDLAAGEICPSLRASALPLPTGVVAALTIKGSNELTARQALELQAKFPGAPGEFAQKTLEKLTALGGAYANIKFVQGISLSDHDWANPRSIVAAILTPALGARANGGALVAIDRPPIADPATRARMKAYVILASHVLWKLGIAPDRESIVLAPAP